ncbi:MAG: HlyD family type I secretion periplasmic adaptor subunit [Gammaproteobacteria bacterium]|nr:HlyD family type I secretion periplasmic adaptor subunit [Gammaproteobacteria bacterium]
MSDQTENTIKAIHARLRKAFETPEPTQEKTEIIVPDKTETTIKAAHARIIAGSTETDRTQADDRDEQSLMGPVGSDAKEETFAPPLVPLVKLALGKRKSLERNSKRHQGGYSELSSNVELNVGLLRTGLAGAFVVAVTFAGFGGWAATAPLASAVVAKGVLKHASERKAIQHIDGGVVRGLLVQDGDVVHQGDPLIRLDDVAIRATLDGLRIRHDRARARKARLVSEKQGLTYIDFQPDLSERQIEDPDIRDLMDNELAIFSARRDILDGEISILTQKILQLEKQIEATEAQFAANNKQLGYARELLAGLNKLFEKGLVEKSRLFKLKREIAGHEGRAGQHVADKARFAKEISETRLQIFQRRHNFQGKVLAELREIDGQIAEISTKIRDADHTVQNSVITAPESGVVMGLTVHSVGEVIKPGATIFELIPEGEPLLVEARIAPREVEDLHLGQKVIVRLTAFRQRTTPDVEGRLVYLSADRFTDERTQQSYYLARVRITPDSLAVLGKRELQPGMPAEVVIESGERTVLAYLARPILDGLSRTWREK